MDSASPGCSVTTTMAYVLYISRIFGTAPLTLHKKYGRWYIKASPAFNVYSIVLIAAFSVLGALALVGDIYMEPEQSMRTSTNSNRFVWIADVSVVSVATLAGAYTGLSRMNYLIAYLRELDKIQIELQMYRQKPPSDRQAAVIVLCSMVAAVFTIFLDYGIFMYKVVEYCEKSPVSVFTSSLYVFYNLSTLTQQVMMLQFAFISLCVLSYIQVLNKCLNDLLQEMKINFENNCLLLNTNHFTNSTRRIDVKSINNIIDSMMIVHEDRYRSTSFPASLHHLSSVYCCLCDVVRQVDESHSFMLVMLSLSYLFHLVITPYHLIINIFNISKSDQSNPILQFHWVVFHLSNLVLTVEPCHRTHVQLDLTKALISNMIRTTPPEYESLVTELKLFYRHIKLNKVAYSPMKMFVLNRKLIVTILGSITTYLVVIVQL